MAHHQRVAEHAGAEPQPVQPPHDRLALAGHVLRVAPAGQDDRVHPHALDLAVLWASIQDLVSSRYSSAPSSQAKWPVSRMSSLLWASRACRNSALLGGTS